MSQTLSFTYCDFPIDKMFIKALIGVMILIHFAFSQLPLLLLYLIMCLQLRVFQ